MGKRSGRAAPRPKPQYLIPRNFEEHRELPGFRCGCYGCQPKLWCGDCLKERQLVLSGTIGQSLTQLLGDAQPRAVGLYEGRGSKDRCAAHNEIMLRRQGQLLPQGAMARLGAEVGIVDKRAD